MTKAFSVPVTDYEKAFHGVDRFIILRSVTTATFKNCMFMRVCVIDRLSMSVSLCLRVCLHACVRLFSSVFVFMCFSCLSVNLLACVSVFFLCACLFVCLSVCVCAVHVMCLLTA